MGHFGSYSLIGVLIYIAIFVVPIAKILRRVGFNGWLSLILLVPPLNVIALWIFAYSDWPALPRER